MEQLKVSKRLSTNGWTGSRYLKNFVKLHINIGSWARETLKKIGASFEADKDVIILTVEQLGFEYGATYEEICARALELGLELCPVWVGPALRIEYRDQKIGEAINVATGSLYDADGEPVIFRLHCDPWGVWLTNRSGNPNRFFRAQSKFAFVLPR